MIENTVVHDRLASLECLRPWCCCHRTSAKWEGLTHCPSHGPDRHPSLSVKLTLTGSLLFHCFAGCSQEIVWRELFGAKPTGTLPFRRPIRVRERTCEVPA